MSFTGKGGITWVDETACSEHTSIPVNTLRSWRLASNKGKHLPFVRIGRLVRYDLDAVDVANMKMTVAA